MWPTRSHCGNWDKVHWLALDPDYKVFSTTMLWINRELITKKRKPKPFNIPASKLSNSHFAYCPVTKRATWLSVGLFSILRKQSRRQQTMSRPSLPAPFPILMTQLGIWILVPHLTWPMIPKVWVFVLPKSGNEGVRIFIHVVFNTFWTFYKTDDVGFNIVSICGNILVFAPINLRVKTNN